MPPFLKFILTAEKRESKYTEFKQILKLLHTQALFDIVDHSFFANEGRSLISFAINYSE